MLSVCSGICVTIGVVFLICQHHWVSQLEENDPSFNQENDWGTMRVKKFFDKTKHQPWFVALLAAFPSLALYAGNLGQATVHSLWKPLLFSLLLAGLIFGFLYLWIKDIFRASIITSVFIVLIFSYGHIYEAVKGMEMGGVLIGRHRYMLVLFGVLAGLAFFLLRIKPEGAKNLMLILNAVTLLLVLFQVVQVVYFEVKTVFINRQTPSQQMVIDPPMPPEEMPDIYLIVLDRYSRSDWLKTWSGHDNSAFLASLEEMGFYVADCSLSNYSHTILSMTSELNMGYLDSLFDKMNHTILANRLKNSLVRQTLSQMGYEFVFYETGFPWIEMTDADHYYEADSLTWLDDFELMFLRTTIFTFPYELSIQMARDDLKQYTFEQLMWLEHASRVQAAFEKLQDPPAYKAPVFVYAHIVSPHGPEIFNEDGSINFDWEDDVDAPRSTYAYVDSQVLKMITAILEVSDPEPIIILQADHGNGEGAYANLILNSYYLPQGGDDLLYPSITPVNTFRLIFDVTFGMDLPLLPDRSYFSPVKQNYDFTLIDDPNPNCQQ